MKQGKAMKTLSILTLGLGLMFTPGCSQETQDKASEAATATGEAVKSAAEDTAENTKDMAEKVEDTLEGDGADGTEN
jgi:outer membrane lipoprotein-sorting protein